MHRITFDCKLRIICESESPARTDCDLKELAKKLIEDTLKVEFDYADVTELTYKEEVINV